MSSGPPGQGKTPRAPRYAQIATVQTGADCEAIPQEAPGWAIHGNEALDPRSLT